MTIERRSDHITIQKLRRNQQLTQQDLDELERIFIEEAGMDRDDLAEIEDQGGLGLFVRSMVGLDQSAAKAAFDQFIEGRTLTANQLEFVDLIISHLTDRGAMEPERLFESPFTDGNDLGVSGVFETADVTNIVDIIRSIKQTARGPEEAETGT